MNVSKGPSFDGVDPPDPKLIDACVHCGFCLTTCPSYRVIGKETDSPRGRIYQMEALNQGQISLSAATVSHFDSCLGCLACVTACPSGVQYDRLIAATRPQIERNYPRSLWDRLYRQFIFSVFPYPERLQPLLWPLWLYQKMGIGAWIRKGLEKVSPRLAAMESLMPPLEVEQLLPKRYPEWIPAVGERRFRVGLILGCVQRLFAPQVNEASIRVLTHNGCEVVIPPVQGCCAALPHHQGQLQQAETLARQMIDAFANCELDAILITASGCGHTLKDYGPPIGPGIPTTRESSPICRPGQGHSGVSRSGGVNGSSTSATAGTPGAGLPGCLSHAAWAAAQPGTSTPVAANPGAGAAGSRRCGPLLW